MAKKNYDLNKAVKISILCSVLFVAAIYLVSLSLGRFQDILLPDTGAAWYYWKLPQMSFWATVTAWSLYILHQISVWYLINQIRKQPILVNNQLTPLNLKLLIVNGIFITLHILQTAFFYDGLAQQVPVMSSQGSVIIMLVLILILMNKRRGLFFGKRIKLHNKSYQAANIFHPFYIAWALVYTFWFHPTEGTLGHLLGFFYMFLLMIQMSLGNTKFHFNIKWITLLEVYVAFHGAIVAVEAQNGMWPMFLFGFMMMFIITGMYGIISQKAVLISLTIIYFVMAGIVYSGVLGNANTLADIHQITWIPIILYVLVFILSWLMGIIYNTLSQRKSNKINTDPHDA
jgi:hypothetical protein